MTYPIALILTNLKERGVSDLDTPCSPLLELPLKEALDREWPSDTFLVTYNATQPIPRLNRAIYPKLPPDFLTSWGACLDWDTPDHIPLEQEHFTHFMDSIPSAPAPNYIWTSRRGMRALYIYNQPISPLESEEVYRGLSTLWNLKFDNTVTLSRWNTVVRLPKVTRDGTATIDDPYFSLQYYSNILLDPSTIPHISADNTAVIFDGSQCPENLEISQEFKDAAAPLLKDALDGRMPDYLRGLPLTHHGDKSLNNQIQRVMGSLAWHLFPLSPTPEQLVGIIQDSIAASITRRILTQGRDLYQEAYKAAFVNLKKEETKQEQKAEEAEDLLTSIQSGFPNAPTENFREYIEKRYILCYRNGRYILQGDGTYDPIPVSSSNLLPAIKRSPIYSLMALRTERGRWLKADELVAQYGFYIREVRAEANLKNAHLAGNVLRLGLYHVRDNLNPTYSSEVDEWLRLFFGKQYEKAANWIGCSLMLNKPICGLSVNGHTGIGKSMLIQGLAECISTETYADDRVFDPNFNTGLEKSPFVCINEGWKTTKGIAGKVYRSLVGGDKVTINEKYQPTYDILVRPRVLLTANNLDALAHLFSAESLTPSDREAIADRVLHVEASREAANWLESKGGRSYTAGWVSPFSNYKVAKHFLWLRGQAVPEQGRFLVSGDREDPVIQKMLSEMGTGPIVGHLLFHMVENNKTMMLPTGAHFVTVSKCLEVYQEVFQNRYKAVFTPLKMKRGLTPWSRAGEERKRVDGAYPRGYVIDWRLLQDFADSHGFEGERCARRYESA